MRFNHMKTIELWNGTVPLSNGTDITDIPTITPFFPSECKKTSHSVIIFPGGGYNILAEHEGERYATFLADNGITAWVVKYRLGKDGYCHPAMLSDACKAVRVVRAHATALGLDPNKIGVMGSSAGGHLAATCSTVPELAVFEDGEAIDIEAGRPNFTILAYPVISGIESWRHHGSFISLLGDNPKPDLLKKLSAEKNVTKKTPAAFIWHTFEDECVPMENSITYAAALRKHNIPFELHIYDKGYHGLGLGEGLDGYRRGERGNHPWGKECIRWIKSL